VNNINSEYIYSGKLKINKKIVALMVGVGKGK